MSNSQLILLLIIIVVLYLLLEKKSYPVHPLSPPPTNLPSPKPKVKKLVRDTVTINPLGSSTTTFKWADEDSDSE